MVTKENITLIFDKVVSNFEEKCAVDGTSFSKELSNELKKFHKNYGGLTDHEELSLYDSKGNLLTHEVGEAHGVGVDLMSYDDYEDLHVFHNHPTLFSDNIPTYLSYNDMITLMLSNYEGSNLLKSVTAVSPNGSAMTLIKTKDFDFNDNAPNVMKQLTNQCADYYELYTDKVIDYMTNKAIEYQENTGKTIRATEFRQEANNHVIKEMGTLQSYLKDNGVFDELASVNLKLKIKKGVGVDG